ncbi:cellulase family glycosylhydrolase [Rhizobacter sp. SG703]|uniref:cellulase family glycosylhydrolase n=1 Tax=Rhizobacter sp. SG703 TaxID=2587140 RepID=UPI0014474C10|nr:cellulase family glycosylhydrolase [Rhizobacter sp. SG703]
MVSNRNSVSSWRAVLAAALLSAAAAGPALADVPALSVRGNQLLVGGTPGSLSGVSYYWSNNGWPGARFYNASTVGWLKSDWKATVVRAAMGVDEAGGYLQDPASNKARLKAVVDAAIANDLYVIIDWHSHYAYQYQAQAIEFFQEMARTYGKNNHVIYEIYNEPKNDASWSGNVKPYAQAVIGAIRAIDPDNLVIVGSPNWSQDADVASRDPITGYANIAYTLHFYAGTHGQFLRDKASTAMANGLALFVTEWGSVNADGNGGVATDETNAWVAFMKAHNLSNANWALDDAPEGSAALASGASSTGGWPESALTASGKLARSIVRGWGGTPPPAACANTALPAKLQAESWCQMSGVQVETTTDADGGSNLGYIDAGDWMTYAVDVPADGNYRVSYRVAAAAGGASLQLEQGGGTPVFGTVDIAGTGGWQNWSTVSHVVALKAGKQVLGVSTKTGGFNLNWLQVERADGSGSTPLATVKASSFSQMSGVQTEATTDSGGGQSVGYIDAGDWLSYAGTPITVPSTGTYTIAFRVASLNGGGWFSFEEAGGAPVYATVSVPATGGWQNWTTIKATLTLTAGTHKFGFKAQSGGWNLNWFSVTPGVQ